jgi:tRNA (mo5U34)-methyltransferase
VTPDELRAEVAKIRWWHSIDLGGGIITPGRTNLADKLEYIGLPQNLAGLSVLDIGAWDGLFSFEAERRGARRVLAVDSFSWNGPGWGTKAGFELARRALGSRVEDREIEVADLSPETVGVFDLVLFLGVLYHLTDPLRALQSVFSVTRSHLILETHVDLMDCPHPAMRFYPSGELSGDPTSFWGPNAAAVEAMLRWVGFRRVELVAQRLVRPPKAKGGRRLDPRRWLHRPRRPRRIEPTMQVFHAWR